MSSLSPASASAFEVKYCSLCDAYFYSEEMLKAHIKSSSRHPKCVTCRKSFLNNNSLRNHYVLSTRHHFCRACEKHFKTIGGLRIHLDFAHLDSDTEDGPTRPDGWEDQQALAEDAVLGGEIPILHEDVAPETLSALATGLAALTLRKSTTCTGVLRPKCPICLSGRKAMCATRCGHVFCSGCITHALYESKSCPACRQPAVTDQLRPLDLHVYASIQ
ncbi:hypothetical protein B0H17DRAFT_1043281 [Mycena rosella]|uniref:RING-type domain-containing protein n=1 Tax=Mycena rosella TaxID=1033263 RepID=A0AAD7GPZ0_MYCRO|nr:hypothetical protein B0H17DRAFT_1043281 [Mycena rosella]